MSTILINSREVLELLEESGIKKEQAKAITKAMETIDASTLMTKADASELEARIYKAMFLQSFIIVGLIMTMLKFLG